MKLFYTISADLYANFNLHGKNPTLQRDQSGHRFIIFHSKISARQLYDYSRHERQF